MSSFRGHGESGDDHARGPGVASDLAEFLIQAAEGKALIQAIGDAHSHPDKPTVTPTRSDVPREGLEMNGDLSFERDLKPLFRESDRATMLSVANFDLWKREDVAEHYQAILKRLEDGSMPCDQAWPDDQVALFRRWVDSGMPE